MEWPWRNNFYEKFKSRFKHIQTIVSSTKTYIIPSFFGFKFLITNIAILYLAMSTGNNLIYLYVFLIASTACVSMWTTNFNVQRVKITTTTPKSHFADEMGECKVILENPSEKILRQITVHLDPQFKSNIVELFPKQTTELLIKMSMLPRGVHKLTRLTISSFFPFGLFYSWKLFNNSTEYYVYPARKGNPQLPWSQQEENKGDSQSNTAKFSSTTQGEKEFWGHRRYFKDDNPRQIDWKAYARTQRLLIKEHRAAQSLNVDLDIQLTKNLRNEEDQLSQLALWIDQCEQQGLNYSLKLGKIQIPQARGPKHYTNCLNHLATYKSGGLV